MNRGGVSGDSESGEGWSHGRGNVERYPAELKEAAVRMSGEVPWWPRAGPGGGGFAG